jgi:hypothetical protein
VDEVHEGAPLEDIVCDIKRVHEGGLVLAEVSEP